jgi:hypothetical protein
MISEKFIPIPLHVGRTGNSTTFAGVKPATGVENVTILSAVNMAVLTDLTANINTADDATGTNATAITSNVPIYRAGTRKTDAKTFTEASGFTGMVSYAVEVPAIIVPEGKYVGLALSAGATGNTISSIALLETYRECDLAGVTGIGV